MKKLFFILVLMTASISEATMICQGRVLDKAVKIELDQNKVIVSGAELQRAQTFTVSEIYDGHMTSLITAPGFSMSFEDWYGCIHNAIVTTNFRDGDLVGYIGAIRIDQCTGGSTSDNLCFAKP